MTLNRGMMSSNSDEWTTPIELFDELHNRFIFDLDAAATDENHLLDRYYTKETDGLRQSWEWRRVFCNPPYSKINLWAAKFCMEAGRARLIVALIPARTDTRWFQSIMESADKIVFLRGRLKFSNSKNSAPFPSALAIWMGLDRLRGENG